MATENRPATYAISQLQCAVVYRSCIAAAAAIKNSHPAFAVIGR